MRRLAAMVATLLVLHLAAAPRARGQTSVILGVGATVPRGALTSSGPFAAANTGWQGTIGFRHAVGSSGVALGARAFYGGNGYQGPRNEESKLGGVTFLGTWTVAEGPDVSPFLWSEAGLLFHRYSADPGDSAGSFFGPPTESNANAALLAGGAGAAIPVGFMEVLVFGGYAYAHGAFDDIQYLLVTAAISIRR